MKYHFVIIQDKADYFRISWNDIHKIEDAEYYDYFPCGCHSRLIRKLFQFHFSSKVREKINLPFKSFWNPFFYTKKNDAKPICFIFSSRYAFFIYSGLIKSLRRKYKNAKFVCFYQDIVLTHKDILVEDAKQQFDLVISYDKSDAEKYGMLYHPTVYSSYETSVLKDDCDVYFVGAAKNRLEKIIDAYDKLTSQGLVCKFYVIGVKPENQVFRDGITYTGRMSYIENVQHVKSTKCILEILQEGAVGYSLRLWEAITYNKVLITNNDIISELREENIGVVSIADVNKTYLQSLSGEVLFNSQWKNIISVKSFLGFVENRLS